jgi:hypothetical protein
MAAVDLRGLLSAVSYFCFARGALTAMIETEPTSQGLVQQFVERAGQLYSLPAAAAEVLRLTESPSVDNRAIKECLERDPGAASAGGRAARPDRRAAAGDAGDPGPPSRETSVGEYRGK